MFRYTLLSKSKSSVYLSLQNATNQVIDHLGHLSGAVYFFAAHPLTQGAEILQNRRPRRGLCEACLRRTPS